MTQETSEDTSSLNRLNLEFEGLHLGSALSADIREILKNIRETVESIDKIYPYLCGLYYTDPQRAKAEMYLYQLQVDLADQHNALTDALVVASDLSRPVPVDVTI